LFRSDLFANFSQVWMLYTHHLKAAYIVLGFQRNRNASLLSKGLQNRAHFSAGNGTGEIKNGVG